MKYKKKNAYKPLHELLSYMLKLLLRGIGLASILLVFGVIGLMLFTHPNKICYGTLLPNQSHRVELAHVVVPESATNIEYALRYLGEFADSNDCIQYIKFHMHSDDWQMLYDSSLLETNNSVQLSAIFNEFEYEFDEINWSMPTSSSEVYTVQKWGCPEINQRILLDRRDDNSWIVHVITSNYEGWNNC